MAEKTASVHVSRILAKLDVRSRTEAAAVAHRHGLADDAAVTPLAAVASCFAARAAPHPHRLAGASPRSSASRAARARPRRSCRSSSSTTGLTGRGEAAPVYYRGETRRDGHRLPGRRRARGSATTRSRSRRSSAGWRATPPARAALDAALHDWVGRRLGVPVWRLLGLVPRAPPTSYTIGIDTLEGTRDRARRARRLPRRSRSRWAAPRTSRGWRPCAPSRTRRCGWTPTRAGRSRQARELVPALVELGVELVEQPFPADDLDSLPRAARAPAAPAASWSTRAATTSRDVAGCRRRTPTRSTSSSPSAAACARRCAWCTPPARWGCV